MREERVVVCMCEVCNREKGGTDLRDCVRGKGCEQSMCQYAVPVNLQGANAKARPSAAVADGLLLARLDRPPRPRRVLVPLMDFRPDARLHVRRQNRSAYGGVRREWQERLVAVRCRKRVFRAHLLRR